jgi:hypothetical protein
MREADIEDEGQIIIKNRESSQKYKPYNFLVINRRETPFFLLSKRIQLLPVLMGLE